MKNSVQYATAVAKEDVQEIKRSRDAKLDAAIKRKVNRAVNKKMSSFATKEFVNTGFDEMRKHFKNDISKQNTEKARLQA